MAEQQDSALGHCPWDHERVIPPLPLGGDGALRSRDAPTIAADNDLEAVASWLNEVRENRNTHAAYRKEAERLLLWAAETRGKALSALLANDYSDYFDFVLDPRPRARWVAQRRVSRSHPDWRPFLGPLSEASRAQARAIINGLLSYLVSVSYLRTNPLASARGKSRASSRRTASRIERFLGPDAIDAVLRHIDAMPTGRVLEEDRRERARWIFTFLRDAGARASEAVSHTMGSIQPDRESGGEFWTWQVRGKGDKEAQVPLAAQTMEALGAYRAHLGLPALPQPGERTPLICRLRGAGRMRQSLTRAALFRIVKDIFRDTATAVRAARPELAEQLESASTHWMRHTSITELAQATGDLRVVQRFGRHNDVRTSMRYIHTLDREVFAAVSRRAKALKQKS